MPIIKTYTSNEEAYRELKNVEYLQSSGTQWIDSGYIPTTTNINVKGRILYTNISGDEFDWLGNLGDGGIGVVIGWYQNKNFLYKTNTTNIFASAVSTNRIYDVEVDFTSSTKTIKDGITTSGVSTNAIPNYSSLIIFARTKQSGKVQRNFKGNIYAIQIKDNNTLVRNYQPVVLNNIGYLYDKVEHKLYGNDGTGSFTYGSILDIEINPQDSGFVDRYYEDGKLNLLATPHEGYEFVNWLLKGYTRLEYIESTGTQYINTNVLPKTTSNFKIKYNCLNYNSSGQAVLYGAINDRAGCFSGVVDNVFYINVGSSSVSGITLTRNTICEDISNGTKYTHNGTIANVSSPTALNIPMYVFGRNNNGSVERISTLKIYYFKIYDGDTLIRDFIPVIRHTDGAIGLLDLVELKFYGNSGTGEFIGGSVYAS